MGKQLQGLLDWCDETKEDLITSVAHSYANFPILMKINLDEGEAVEMISPHFGLPASKQTERFTRIVVHPDGRWDCYGGFVLLRDEQDAIFAKLLLGEGEIEKVVQRCPREDVEETIAAFKKAYQELQQVDAGN